ncbi:MAG TPA: carbonic anhydrase [Kamptonema sp.]|nr:carbonic anhydrase [Kamptonema sp.]
MNQQTKLFSRSRRNLLQLGAGAIGTGLLTAGISSQFDVKAQTVEDNNISPDQALKLLMDGNKRFTTKKPQNINRGFERLSAVAKSQKPFAAILGCADSRVPSEIIFDRGFGDLFICRVAGNVATSEETGSLEFGTLVLGAKVIMVLGHKRCGAVDATIKGIQVPGQIGSLMDAIKPAIPRSEGQLGDRLENASKANVLVQAERLKTSPVISQLIQEGKLKIVGAYYDLDTGEVSIVS